MKKIKNFEKAGIIIIFILSFLLRAGYQWEFHKTPFAQVLFLDSDYYNRHARLIAGGDLRGGDQVFFFGPGYSYTLALIYKITNNSISSVRVLQGFAGFFSSFIAFIIGRRLFGPIGGFITFFLMALNPVLIFYETQLLMASFLLFLFSLWSLVVIINHPKDPLWLHGFCGILSGIMATYRGNFLIMFLPLWLVAIKNFFQNKKKGLDFLESVSFLAKMILGPLMIIITISPILWRNWSIDGQWPVLTSNVGVLLWHGNITDSPAINTILEEDRLARNPQLLPSEDGSMVDVAMAMMEKAEESNIWLDRLYKLAHMDPKGLIGGYFLKMAQFFNYFEIPKNVSFNFFRERSPLLSLPLPNFRIIIPLFLPFIFTKRAWRGDMVVLLSAAWLYILIMSLFFVNSRFRIPVLGLISVFAGGFGREIFAFFKRGQTDIKKENKGKNAAIGFFSLLIIFAALLANWPISEALYPSSAGYYQLAHVLKEKGDFEGAIKTLKLHIELNPNSVKSYNDLVLLYLKTKNIKNAIETANKGLKLNPHYYKLHFNLAMALANMGEIERAFFQIRQGLQYGYTDAAAQEIAGDLAAKLERYGEAILYYKEAKKLSPENANISKKLAHALFSNGDINELLNLLKIPGLDELCDPYMLGQAYFLGNDVSMARKYFFSVPETSANRASALCNLAIFEMQQNNIPAATGFLEEALALEANDEGILFDLSILWINQGDYERANYLLKRLVALQPQDIKAQFALAESLMLSERKQEARKLLSHMKSFDLNKNEENFRLQLLEKLDKLDKQELSGN